MKVFCLILTALVVSLTLSVVYCKGGRGLAHMKWWKDNKPAKMKSRYRFLNNLTNMKKIKNYYLLISDDDFYSL